MTTITTNKPATVCTPPFGRTPTRAENAAAEIPDKPSLEVYTDEATRRQGIFTVVHCLPQPFHATQLEDSLIAEVNTPGMQTKH